MILRLEGTINEETTKISKYEIYRIQNSIATQLTFETTVIVRLYVHDPRPIQMILLLAAQRMDCYYGLSL